MKRVLVVLLLIAILVVVAKIFVCEIPVVTGNDMAPALQAGDRLLAYRLNTTPARGDLVLMEVPLSKQLLLRRVVAIPGDRIAVRDETPVLNGAPAKRKVQRETTLRDPGGKELKVRVIEEELGDGPRYLVLKDPRRRSVDAKEVSLSSAYYVLADHRNHGTDSRTFGPVDAAKIRAVITHRLSAGPAALADLGPRAGWMALR
jgi:signal peptidase I